MSDSFSLPGSDCLTACLAIWTAGNRMANVAARFPLPLRITGCLTAWLPSLAWPALMPNSPKPAFPPFILPKAAKFKCCSYNSFKSAKQCRRLCCASSFSAKAVLTALDKRNWRANMTQDPRRQQSSRYILLFNSIS